MVKDEVMKNENSKRGEKMRRLAIALVIIALAVVVSVGIVNYVQIHLNQKKWTLPTIMW